MFDGNTARSAECLSNPARTDAFPYLPEEPYDEDEVRASVSSVVARSAGIRPDGGFTLIESTRPFHLKCTARASHARCTLGTGFHAFCTGSPRGQEPRYDLPWQRHHAVYRE